MLSYRIKVEGNKSRLSFGVALLDYERDNGLKEGNPGVRIMIQARGNLQQPICGNCNTPLPPVEMNRGYYFKPKDNPDWWGGAIADICIQCPQCQQEVKVAELGIR